MDENRKNSEYGPPETSAYSDAYYRKAPESRRAYGYNPVQCYAHASESAPAPRKKKHRSGWAFALTCFVCVLLAGLLGTGGMFFVFRADAAGEEDANDASSREIYEDYTSAAETDETALALVRADSAAEQDILTAEQIYVAACQSTVGVTVPGYAYNIFGQSGSSTVTGTGIVLSEDGYILTNFHVIEDAYASGASIRVIVYDGTAYDAQVIGVETDSDLAVVKIDAQSLTPAVFGDSDEMRVGQTIYTVGNPLGELTYTMTSGIVSALDRQITTDENVTVNMFQIDAAVNNGNSGGPVFNVYGQVIGVVTAKYSQYGMEGLGFAIPTNDACDIAGELAAKGYVSGKAYLGLTLTNVSASVARYYGMVRGVYVYDVEEDSCASEAGLRIGDIITAIDGTQVSSSEELVRLVKTYRAGDSAVLTVYRDQEYIPVTVEFDEALPAKAMTQEEAVLRASTEAMPQS